MPFGKPKEPKAPKEKKPKKEKPPKKPKPPKKEKAPKKPKPPKKAKPPKKPKKGQQPPVEGEEGLEQELEQGQKRPIFLLLIPIVLLAVSAVAVFLFVLPHRETADPGVVETEEPKPPELPEELLVGEESVPGMTLEADESGALAVLAKTITYTYTNLNDAGKAAETYVGQLRAADPSFSIVDEEYVRQSEMPDFTTPEGMVLMARNLPKPEPEVEATPAPTEEPEVSGEPEASGAPEESEPAQSPDPEESAEPVDEAPDMVLTVRITWSEGKCVVTADEAEGKVTSPPPQSTPGGRPSIGIRDAGDQIMSMTPVELGLPGTSMADYEVWPQNSLEKVDGENCIRVDVYNGSTGSNPYAFAGSYLMSMDGAHLYRLDPVTNTLQELEFTLNP